MVYWGTHDSLSYARPQFMLLFFRFMCQTQTLSVDQQYDWGARIFDFRLKSRNGMMISGHGPCTFDVNVTEKVEYLATKDNVTIRFAVEGNDEEDLYVSYYKWLVEQFSPRITFMGLWYKRDWRVLVPGNGTAGTSYTTEPGYDNDKFPFPKLYAEQFNWKSWERINNGEFGILDFPEIQKKLHHV